MNADERTGKNRPQMCPGMGRAPRPRLDIFIGRNVFVGRRLVALFPQGFR